PLGLPRQRPALARTPPVPQRPGRGPRPRHAWLDRPARPGPPGSLPPDPAALLGLHHRPRLVRGGRLGHLLPYPPGGPGAPNWVPIFGRTVRRLVRKLRFEL